MKLHYLQNYYWVSDENSNCVPPTMSLCGKDLLSFPEEDFTWPEDPIKGAPTCETIEHFYTGVLSQQDDV